jgi:hypothetical protein
MYGCKVWFNGLKDMLFHSYETKIWNLKDLKQYANHDV